MEKKRRKTETAYIVGEFSGENCQLTGELTVVGFHMEKFHGNVPRSHALRRFAKEVVSRNKEEEDNDDDDDDDDEEEEEEEEEKHRRFQPKKPKYNNKYIGSEEFRKGRKNI
ncbi:hypothetical protein T03_18181 [Trichinella britovi]|uniref:Uncharacterized protein n=1 Tax=Trichinella britovi TaxID=45882 RepID=A0A0V1CZW2_TRIBR|nr:hypothetical protein T03_18181 [Trichinella britovi]